jgi:hypothetical protein
MSTDTLKSYEEPSALERIVARTMTKYRNRKTTRHGITFASKKEADRYDELLLLAKAGAISAPQRQARFPLRVNGELVCTYVSDFDYFDAEKQTRVIEDAKGFRTREYIIKRKLMKAIHGIEITEV